MNFSKLHGAGNDFLLFDGSLDPSLDASLPPLISRLCDRRMGLGADGVLLLSLAGSQEVKVKYWNSDGSVASFCGNGTRCAARFAQQRWGFSEMILITDFAPIPGSVKEKTVALRLPAPTGGTWLELPIGEGTVRGFHVVLGVPQLIVPVDWPDFSTRPLAPLAPILRSHPLLPPGGANVNFIQHISGHDMKVRSWERGIEGETLACASGAVCAALTALSLEWCQDGARLLTASGRWLEVTSLGLPPLCPSILDGPAEWVADGSIHPDLFL